MDSNNDKSLREAVIEALESVYDPEIPVNIFALGLVYEVKVDDGKVHVLMTLTSPNCPVAESLPMEVKQKIEELEDVIEADVEITFDPPWDEDMMSDEALLELGLL
ncbi:MAG TPA: iron-sulfur cluster assembly protein [Bacteroidales bacterium]|nr:iron-sulfur cluster assembly protein [Bacteroidales bacterium]